jgi:hypothetical protein
MGLLARLFSNPKAVGEMATSAVKGLDSIVYTEQERAEKTEAATALYSKMWMAAVPSAVSRRIIATAIVLVWAVLVLGGVILYAFGMSEAAKFTMNVLESIVLQPMNIVVGFYFIKTIVTEYRKGKG